MIDWKAALASLALLVLLAPPASAGRYAKPQVTSLKWLQGHWVDIDEGRRADEHWGVPSGDSMVGMFRLQEAGITKFVELQTIVPEGRHLILRIRHMSAQLEPWKSEADGPLRYTSSKIREGEAVFDHATDKVKRIVYRRVGANGLLIRLIFREGRKVMDFKFTRAVPRPSGAKSSP